MIEVKILFIRLNEKHLEKAIITGNYSKYMNDIIGSILSKIFSACMGSGINLDIILSRKIIWKQTINIVTYSQNS